MSQGFSKPWQLRRENKQYRKGARARNSPKTSPQRPTSSNQPPALPTLNHFQSSSHSWSAGPLPPTSLYNSPITMHAHYKGISPGISSESSRGNPVWKYHHQACFPNPLGISQVNKDYPSCCFLHQQHTWYPRMSRYELPGGCCEQNLGLRQEQHVLLTSWPALQTPRIHMFKRSFAHGCTSL